MITKLRIKNYKSIGEDLTALQLKPLTIFAGKNSSGKSNILEIIAILAQTTRLDRNIVRSLEGSLGYGEFIRYLNTPDFPLFEFIAHKKDLKRHITIETHIADESYNEIGYSYSFMPNDREIHHSIFENEKKLVELSSFKVGESSWKRSFLYPEKLKSLNIDKKGPFIGLGVRLSEQKGITYLLKAMPEIKESFPDIALIIAGNGPLENELKNEAVSLGIKENVFFIGPRLDLNEVLNILDVYTLPSLWEGLPMVILEAMAAECPIVATDVGGNATAIQNNVSGSLVKSKEPESLASEIIRLLKDEKLRNKYRQNSLQIFYEKFSASIMTKKYEQLYLKEF